MGFDAYEQLAVDPGAVGDVARSILETPSEPGESYADTQYRSAQQAGATARIQAIKGKQWAARGVPSYQDMQGNTKPVVDDTGSPLNKLDPKHNIAYDSTGSPKKIDFDVASGSPVLKDPFEGLETTTDPKTGHQYKIAPGLPWRWVSTDAQIAQKAEFAREDALLSRFASLNGGKATLLEKDAIIHTRKMKDAHGQLDQLGVQTSNEAGDPLDYDSLVAGINSHYDEQKKDKKWAGNQKAYFGMGDYTPEALKAQQALDLSRTAALRAAAEGHAQAQSLAQLQEQHDELQRRKDFALSRMLDHETQLLRSQGIDIGGQPQQPPVPQLDAPGAAQPGQPTAIPPEAMAAARGAAGAIAPEAATTQSPGPEPEGMAASLLRPLLTKTIPAVGTAVGGLAGGVVGGSVGALTAPVTGPAGAIGGAFAGNVYGGAKGAELAQDAQDALMGEKWTKENEAQIEANMKANPTMTKIGAFIPAILSTLGSPGKAIKDLGKGILARFTAKTVAANPTYAAKALSSLPELMTVGARMNAGGVGEKIAHGEADYSDVFGAAVKGAVTMGPMAFIPGASSFLGQVLARPATEAATLATSNALYDHMVEGKDIDFGQLAKDIGTDIPGFALAGLFHRYAPKAKPPTSGETPPAAGGKAPPENSTPPAPDAPTPDAPLAEPTPKGPEPYTPRPGEMGDQPFHELEGQPIEESPPTEPRAPERKPGDEGLLRHEQPPMEGQPIEDPGNVGQQFGDVLDKIKPSEPKPPTPNDTTKLPDSKRNDQSKPDGAKPAGGATEVAKTEEGKPGGEPAGQPDGKPAAKPDAETLKAEEDALLTKHGRSTKIAGKRRETEITKLRAKEDAAKPSEQPAPAPVAEPTKGSMTQPEMDEAIAVLLKAPVKAGGKPRVSLKTQAEEAWFRRGFEAANGKPGQPPPEQPAGVPAKEQKLHDAFASGWSHAQIKLREKPTPSSPAPAAASVTKDSVDAFVQGMTPMAAKRARNALDESVSSGGMPYQRKELIQNAVEAGATVQTRQAPDTDRINKLESIISSMRKSVPFGNTSHPDTIRYNDMKAELAAGPKITTRRLVNPDGSFRDESQISKTAMDYAEHLIRNKAKPAAAPAPEPQAQSFTEKVRAKIVPGAKVSVQLVRGAKLAHPAVVGDVFLDSNGKPESVSVTFDGGGDIKKGRTQTVPFGNVSLRPGVESRMLTNEQFNGMTPAEKRKTQVAAKEFKKLVIEYPELGFYDGRLEAVAAGPQGEAAIKKARADAVVKAMVALGVHPDKADARDAVTQASLVEKMRELTKKPGMERKQYADFQEAKEEGDGEIKAGDLKYGETINIGGEEMRVTDIDKDGVVTLQDGDKFGAQEVHPDESLMIKDETIKAVHESNPDIKEDMLAQADSLLAAAQELGYPSLNELAAKDPAKFAELAEQWRKTHPAPHGDTEGGGADSGGAGKAEVEVATPREAAAPKLRPGERGTGELLQGADQPFNLMGEQGVDTLKQAADKAKAEADAAEAKAKFDREQGNLFDDAQSLSEKAPETSLPVASVQRAVKGIADNLKGAMPHEVIADGDGFPDRVKESAKKRGITDLNRIRGAVVDGKIWINAAAIEHPGEAVATFMHEAAGHGGVDAIINTLPEGARKGLDSMLRRMFKAEYDAVARSYEPHEQISETLARIMERVGPKMAEAERGRWSRVVDWFRGMLNRIGVKEWSKEDVQALLRRGVDAVREPKVETPEAGAVKMSAKDEANRITPEQDREYLAAVKRGDMETAQRMVDAAAKKAGYDLSGIREAAGLYKYYSDKAKKTERSEDYDALENFGYKYNEQAVKAGLSESASSQMLSDVGTGMSESDAIRDAIATTQIKSADPITRDADGRVVPLSERFKPESSDIRFSLKPDSFDKPTTKKPNEQDTNTREENPATDAEKITARGSRDAGAIQEDDLFTGSEGLDEKQREASRLIEGFSRASKAPISRVSMAEGETGIATGESGVIQFDPVRLAESIALVERKGGDGKAWAKSVFNEEEWHNRQMMLELNAVPFRYAKFHSQLVAAHGQEFLDAMREIYPSTKPWVIAAEFERMILQHRAGEKISESHYRDLSKLMPFIEGAQPVEFADHVLKAEDTEPGYDNAAVTPTDGSTELSAAAPERGPKDKQVPPDIQAVREKLYAEQQKRAGRSFTPAASSVRYPTEAELRPTSETLKMGELQRKKVENLKAGDVINYGDADRIVGSVRKQENGASYWVDFEDGNSVKFSHGIELPIRKAGTLRDEARKGVRETEGSATATEAGALSRAAEDGPKFSLKDTPKEISEDDQRDPSKFIAAAKKAFAPGLDAIHGIKEGIQSLVLPSANSPEHLKAAEDVASKLGPMHRRQESANARFNDAWKTFEKAGVHREDVPISENPGIKFMSDASVGREMTPEMQKISDAMDAEDAKRQDLLEKAGVPMQKIRENYFPGIWTNESREAFALAMEQAKKEGIIKEGENVNAATPEQKAWVKDRVDKAMEKGEGKEDNDGDALGYLTKTPLKGKESFRKQKVFTDDIRTAFDFGLRAASNNPVDIRKLKWAEMDRAIMGSEVLQKWKADGAVVGPFFEAPDASFERIKDKVGTVYGNPDIPISEAFDKNQMDALDKVADALNIPKERRVKVGGSGRWGYQQTGGAPEVVTKFGGPESVLAHEIGHAIDDRYNVHESLLEHPDADQRRDFKKELRALADARFEGGEASDSFKRYVRKGAEKAAVMVEAYIHAPEKFREVAPHVMDWLESKIDSDPKLAGLRDAKPSLVLGSGGDTVYAGGMVVRGYLYAKKSHADILNNYLSSSLYNNRYFGKLYTGWMKFANVLNQAQLGVGSAFHAGFTTMEAWISSAANVMKDAFGVLNGSRTMAHLGESAKNFLIAPVETYKTGDKVLNAWRNPDGTIDPKIAQVVRAAELAGGGFTMERGLKTDQASRTYSDWNNGHKLRAALRSPVAATEMLAYPIMNGLVPRQKAGVFAHMANRIIEQNPGKTMEELTPQFRQAWNRVDARLGQVRYDRLFANNAAKNVVQGLVRAPGWSGGTITELGGAFKDTGNFFKQWAKDGKMPKDIPDRVAYTASLMLGVGITNAALTYAFTGDQPEGMDYWAFRTGGKDARGEPERFVLPTYMKDVLAYMKAPLTTLTDKAHPILGLAGDLYRNKDYYGVEVRHEDDGAVKQIGQAGKHVVKAFVPFWIRGEQKLAESGDASAGKMVAPLIGVMPAPKKMTETDAMAKAGEINKARIPSLPVTEQQAEKRIERSSLLNDLRRGDRSNIPKAIADGAIKPADLPKLIAKARMAPIVSAVQGMTVEQIQRVNAVATPEEQKLLAPIIRAKQQRARDKAAPKSSSRNLTSAEFFR